MNILTFDIEEWYLEKTYFGGNKERIQKCDYYLNAILEKLDERCLKGTFFCVGGMGREFPEVVKKIASRGHEIGCHSDKHVWLNKLSREECFEDTRIAVDSLEQCIGKKILSYRAPAFSIGEKNKWALEVLAENGIKRDASIFPALRDFGGFSNFGYKSPVIVYKDRARIKEFPICTTKLFGKEIAYSGGGYFRFFPLWFVQKEIHKSDYSMTYFHIADLIPETTGMLSKKDYEYYFKESGTLKNRFVRYVKTNLGKKSAFDKLMFLLDNEDFVNLEQADSMINWDNVQSVIL